MTSFLIGHLTALSLVAAITHTGRDAQLKAAVRESLPQIGDLRNRATQLQRRPGR